LSRNLAGVAFLAMDSDVDMDGRIIPAADAAPAWRSSRRLGFMRVVLPQAAPERREVVVCTMKRERKVDLGA
ncbi:MAG TPA: hypothetical protein VJ835_11740, partial [Fimbriimonadaceae bacterium]|nr:hypothetical protein [Fimbriimonadaceae bacterium]